MTGDLFNFVKAREGLRLLVYLCPAGYPTIGYGHRVKSMSHPPISREQAEAWLMQDLMEAEAAAIRLCPNLWPAGDDPGKVHPFALAALTDLVFNVGWGALDGRNPEDPMDDARVVQALRAEDWERAAAELREWCHARVDGKVVELPGLVERRHEASRWILKEATA